MSDLKDTAVSYYDWEGEAARVYTHADGSLTADTYRAGKGPLAVDPVDVMFEAKPIGQTQYQDIVLEQIELHKRKGSA